MKNLLLKPKKKWYVNARELRIKHLNLLYPDYFDEGWGFYKYYPKIVYNYQLRGNKSWKRHRKKQYKNGK